MEKFEQLMDMTEHPERYTEEQFREMLADEECREMYDMMTATDEAFILRSTPPAAGRTDEEWRKFERRHFGGRREHGGMRAAAAVAVLLVVSGIAFAAIRLGVFGGSRQPADVPSEPSAPVVVKAAAVPEQADTAVVSRTFENTELETMLSEMAAHYNIKVRFGSERARHLRLYYDWDSRQRLGDIVRTLNCFDNVDIMLTDSVIIVN